MLSVTVLLVNKYMYLQTVYGHYMFVLICVSNMSHHNHSREIYNYETV